MSHSVRDMHVLNFSEVSKKKYDLVLNGDVKSALFQR